jgi:hypothetical protein
MDATCECKIVIVTCKLRGLLYFQYVWMCMRMVKCRRKIISIFWGGDWRQLSVTAPRSTEMLCNHNSVIFFISRFNCRHSRSSEAVLHVALIDPAAASVFPPSRLVYTEAIFAAFSQSEAGATWLKWVQRQGWPGVDVMITNFCDFCQFSAKKTAFFSKTEVVIKILHNLALFWVKNANFFAIVFGENI